MFSEYASKFLSKSQRPAPLFDGGISGVDTDTDLGPLQESVASTDSVQSDTDSSPPFDLAVERPGSLWASHLQQWGGAPHTDRGVDPSIGGNGNGDGVSSVSRLPSSLPSNVPSNATSNGIIASSIGTSTGPYESSYNTPENVGFDSAAYPPHIPRGGGNRAPNAGPTEASSVAGDQEAPADLVVSVDTRMVDNVVGAVYLTMMALSLATASLIVLTTAPNDAIGGVYPVFAHMARPLAAYAAVASIVAAVWLLAMRHNARAVLQFTTIGVPVILGILGIYSLLRSVHTGSGHGWAHAALRVSALIPLVVAVLWVAVLRRSKRLVGRATEMIVLAVSVFTSCKPLLAVTLGSSFLALSVTGLWALFVSRTFLEGRSGIILVAWFSLMYLWTWGVMCTLLTVVLAGVTSQWYQLKSPSGTVHFGSAVHQAGTRHFGSCCTAALVGLVVRVPLLVLPTRPRNWLAASSQALLSAPVVRLLDPLTLPTAVVRRCSLHRAARAVAQLPQFQNWDKASFALAHTLLTAARACCALAVALLAWVHADRMNDASSVYGYLVALVALFTGWTVVGACENVLGLILDSLAVCYVLDTPPKRADVDRVFLPEPLDA